MCVNRSVVMTQVGCTSSARAGFEVFLSSDAAILLTDAMFLYLSILKTNRVIWSYVMVLISISRAIHLMLRDEFIPEIRWKVGCRSVLTEASCHETRKVIHEVGVILCSPLLLA